MIGGARFALARARDASAPLLALAVVAAVSVSLGLGLLAAIRAFEDGDVRATLGNAGASAAVTLTPNESVAEEALAAAADEALQALGVSDSLTVETGESGVRVTPALSSITAAGVAPAREALSDLGSEVGAIVDTRVQVSGGLRDALGALADDLAQRRGPAAVAVALLLVAVGVVVGAVALEPVRARAAELGLLRARGMRGRSLVGITVIETGVVVAVGAIVGAGVAAVVSVSLGVRVQLLESAVAVVTVVLTAVIAAAAVVRRIADSRETRARTAALVSVAMLGAVVIGVAVWQFAQTGDPYVVRADGSLVLDPLVAVAPALALLLAALLAVMLATPLQRLVARLLSRSAGVAPVTPLRLASRRPARHGFALTTVAFAVGAVTVGLAYQGTVSALGRTPEDARVGADVRVTAIPENLAVLDVAASADAEGAMAVRTVPGRAGDDRINVLAAQADRLGAVMSDVDGLIDTEAMAAAVTVGASGIPLPAADLRLQVEVPTFGEWAGPDDEVQDAFAPTNVRVLLMGEGGALWSGSATNATLDDSFAISELPVDAEFTAVFSPPAGTWRLAWIEVDFAEFYGFVDANFGILGATSGGEAVDLTELAVVSEAGEALVVGDGLLLTLGYGNSGTIPQRLALPGAPSALAAVITEQLAADLGLEVGDTLTLPLTRPTMEAEFEVTATTEILPGTPTGQGILVDLAALTALSIEPLRANELWLSTEDAGATIERITADHGDLRILVADPRAAQKAGAAAISLLWASIAAACLAVAILLLRRSRRRGDDRELAMLALLGLGRRGAARLRAQEDGTTVVLGTLSGLVAGIATAILVVPTLVRSAYGDMPDNVAVDVDFPALWLAMLAVTAVVIFGGVAVSVRAPTDLARALREDE